MKANVRGLIGSLTGFISGCLITSSDHVSEGPVKAMMQVIGVPCLVCTLVCIAICATLIMSNGDEQKDAPETKRV